jgi:hypothetical protein
MSYAESRSKLANLLIKAGYDVAKSLRAVKYPYIESMQLVHNLTFYDYLTEDIKQYENPQGDFVTVPESGFAHTVDTEYEILGNKNKAKAFLRISQARVNHWKNFGGGNQYAGTFWYTYVLKVITKYRHKYPSNEIQDTVKTIGDSEFGVATVGGDYGHQEGTIPIPDGGWLEVELPEE